MGGLGVLGIAKALAAYLFDNKIARWFTVLLACSICERDLGFGNIIVH